VPYTTHEGRQRPCVSVVFSCPVHYYGELSHITGKQRLTIVSRIMDRSPWNPLGFRITEEQDEESYKLTLEISPTRFHGPANPHSSLVPYTSAYLELSSIS